MLAHRFRWLAALSALGLTAALALSSSTDVWAQAQTVRVFRPDLTVGLAATPNPAAWNQLFTYTVTVRNVAEWYLNFNNGTWQTKTPTAQNVRVDLYVPLAIKLTSQPAPTVSGGGFQCSVESRDMLCTGGMLAPDQVATITVSALAPPYPGFGENNVFSSMAAIDPNNTIAERSEGNNSLMISVQFIRFPVALAITEYSQHPPGVVLTDGSGSVSYTIKARNPSVYPVNVKLTWGAAWNNAWNGTVGTDRGFTCTPVPAYEGVGADCVGLLPAGATVTETVTEAAPIGLTETATYFTEAGVMPTDLGSFDLSRTDYIVFLYTTWQFYPD